MGNIIKPFAFNKQKSNFVNLGLNIAACAMCFI